MFCPNLRRSASSCFFRSCRAFLTGVIVSFRSIVCRRRKLHLLHFRDQAYLLLLNKFDVICHKVFVNLCRLRFLLGVLSEISIDEDGWLLDADQLQSLIFWLRIGVEQLLPLFQKHLVKGLNRVEVMFLCLGSLVA